MENVERDQPMPFFCKEFNAALDDLQDGHGPSLGAASCDESAKHSPCCAFPSNFTQRLAGNCWNLVVLVVVLVLVLDFARGFEDEDDDENEDERENVRFRPDTT